MDPDLFTGAAKCVYGCLRSFHLPDLGPKISICKMLTKSMCFIALWWHAHQSRRLLLLPVAGVCAAGVREAGATGSEEKSSKYWSGPYFIFRNYCQLLL